MLIPTAVQQVTAGTELIHDETLSVDGAGFDITGIPQTYTSLLYFMTGRSADVANVDTALGRFNGDSGANYDRLALAATDANNPFKAGGLSQTSFWIAELGAANAATGRAGQSTGWIQHYADSVFFKNVTVNTVVTNLDNTATIETGQLGAIWLDTDPINRITIVTDSGANFVAGSRFTLYGLI